MDVANIVAQVEMERQIAAKRLADLDQLLEALRRFDGTRALTADAATKTARPVQSKATAEHWADARQQYEAGTPISEIAKWFPLSDASLYARMKQERWKKPQPQDHA